MRIFLISLGLLLVGTTLFAQAPYTGGAGDGYAKTGNTFVIGEPISKPPAVQIGWEEGINGSQVILWFENLADDAQVIIYDIRGKELIDRKVVARGSHQETISLVHTSTAVYLFKIILGPENTFSRKVLNPYHQSP